MVTPEDYYQGQNLGKSKQVLLQYKCQLTHNHVDIPSLNKQMQQNLIRQAVIIKFIQTGED